jgi:hypothetical protein
MHQNILQKNWGPAFIVPTSLTGDGNIKKWHVTWEFALTSNGKHTGTQNKQCSQTGGMPSHQSCSVYRYRALQTARTQQTSCSKSQWRHSCTGKNIVLDLVKIKFWHISLFRYRQGWLTLNQPRIPWYNNTLENVCLWINTQCFNN